MNNFPKYDRYKDSGVEWLGEIPAEWECGRLKNSLREIDDRSSTGTESLLSLRMNVGLVPHNDVSDVPISDYQLIGYKRVKPGEIVMNRMRACFGIFAVARSNGLVSPDYAVFEITGDYNASYLLRVFKTEQMMTEMRRYSKGLGTGESGFLRLYTDKFLNIRIPTIARPEQDRIVTFLDRKAAEIDALIAKKQRQIELLDEHKAILINRAVTRGLNPNAKLKPSGIEWIGDIPAHWEVKRLRYLCVVGTGERDTKNSISAGEYPFFVRSQTPERINSYGFDCEAVLTAGDGAGVGKVFHHLIGKFDAHQRVYVMRDFVGVLGRYFFLFLRENFHRVALTGDAKSTVDSLRRSMLTDFPIPLPPEDEQLAIIQHCDEISGKIADLGKTTLKEIQSLKTLRSTLITHAVTGRIKV